MHPDEIWEGPDPESPLYVAEARDYVRRLGELVGIAAGARVLDYGCGFGLIAVELSPRVRELALWDPSPHRRAVAAANTARLGNARVLAAPPAPDGGRFDVVVVNSVLQYLDDDAATLALRRLAGVLAPAGSIVVSDVVTPGARLRREVVELLWFGVRQRVLGAVLHEGRSLARIRLGSARQHRYRQRTRADVERLAASAELATEWLPASLTARRERLAALLRPAG